MFCPTGDKFGTLLPRYGNSVKSDSNVSCVVFYYDTSFEFTLPVMWYFDVYVGHSLDGKPSVFTVQ